MELNFQRLSTLIRKETIQILRDRRFILLFLGLAFVQLFIYGYSASKTVYHMPLAVVDQSRNDKSQAFVTALVNSQYFDATLYLQSQDEVIQAINKGQVKAGVVIPPNFAANAMKGSADFLIVLDGSDQFAVGSAYSAVNLVAQHFGLQLTAANLVLSNGNAATSGASASLPITADARVSRASD